jgi:hypothetical protein
MESLSFVGCRALREVVPEGDAELGAGLAEAEEGVATGAADIAAVPSLTLRLESYRCRPHFCPSYEFLVPGKTGNGAAKQELLEGR